MTRNVRTWFKYEPKTLVDLGNQKSATIPGQEVSLRKILEQHSRGMPLPADMKGQYFGDLDVPDFEEMDLAELMDYTSKLRNEIDMLSESYERAQQTENQRVTKRQQTAKSPNKETDDVSTSESDATDISN